MTKKIFSKPQAVIGLILITIIIICAIFAPVIAPNPPDQIDPSLKYHEADANYPLGTDQLGRCELSRLIYGARYSIGMSVPMMLILGVLGLIIGTFSACAGEKVDRIITFICDVFISFPSLITAIAVISILGNGIQNIAIAVVISMWAWFARMVRSYAVTEMGKEYITAARISGCGTAGLIFRHLIPNILPQCIVYMSTGVASAIIMEITTAEAIFCMPFPRTLITAMAVMSDGKEIKTSQINVMILSAFHALFTVQDIPLE